MKIFWTHKSWEAALDERVREAYNTGIDIGITRAETNLILDTQTPVEHLCNACFEQYAASPTPETGEMLRFLMKRDWADLEKRVRHYMYVYEQSLLTGLYY